MGTVPTEAEGTAAMTPETCALVGFLALFTMFCGAFTVAGRHEVMRLDPRFHRQNVASFRRWKMTLFLAIASLLVGLLLAGLKQHTENRGPLAGAPASFYAVIVPIVTFV